MEIYYLPSHEYIKVDGNVGYIGVSEYAAKQLGAVTYVDMPEEGDNLEAGKNSAQLRAVRLRATSIRP